MKARATLLAQVVLYTLFVFFSFNSFAAVGNLFKIQVVSYGTGPGGITLPDDVKTQIDAALADIATEVNKKLPEADASSYLHGMANSGAMAVKGLGVDYASAPEIFVVGAGVGVGADVGNNSLSDVASGDVEAEQIRGVGLQASVMAGINMKIFNISPWTYFDPNKLNLFINFWQSKLPGTGGDIEGKISNFGIHAQYQIVDDFIIGSRHLFRWGGVYFTTGFDHAYMKLAINKTFTNSSTKSMTLNSMSDTLRANFAGRVYAGAEVTANTIPFELSTHLQLLHFLTLYAGPALDWNFGKAKALASLTGDVTAEDDLDLINGLNARASLDLGQSGTPSTITPRIFGGLQLNVTLLKMYVQLNHGLGQNTYGVNAGVRIAY